MSLDIEDRLAGPGHSRPAPDRGRRVSRLSGQPGQTPTAACAARPKAIPGDRAADSRDRIRTGIIGATGTATLRTGGKLYHIGVGRARARTHIIMLIQDLDIRIINAATGELLRELTLDTSRDYQPTGQPPGPKTKTP